MKLMDRLRKVFNSSGTPTVVEAEVFAPKMTASGKTVDINSALSLSAVYAAVRVLSETIATLPLSIYERTEGGKKIAENHPLNVLLHTSPNPEMTACDVRQVQMSHLLLRGMSYTQIIRLTTGKIAQLIPLLPQDMEMDRTSSGDLIYVYDDPDTGSERTFRSSEIWRISGLSWNGLVGLTPISLARESWGLSLAQEEQAAKLYSNGSQVPYTLEMETALSDEAFDRLQKSVASHQGSGNSHKPMILENGLKANTLGLSASDAQFLESRKFTVAEIARWFGLPPHMLADLDRATFSNIEQQSIDFVQHSIRRWLVRIEQSISRDLIRESERRRYFAEHKVEGLLRGDTQSRFNAYATAITNGWMSRNEVRVLENDNRVEGLDEFLVPLNMEPASAQRASAILEDVAALIVKKESAFLERAVKQKDYGAIPKFYEEHVDQVMNKLHVGREWASTYCSRQLDEVRHANNVKELTQEWKTTKPAQILRELTCETSNESYSVAL